MSGRCAKQDVVALLVKGNKIVIGRNTCLSPQEECPRRDLPSGEGYKMCWDICIQPRHAEVDALIDAQASGMDVRGATCYIIGRTYACDHCKQVLKSQGITDIRIVGGE